MKGRRIKGVIPTHAACAMACMPTLVKSPACPCMLHATWTSDDQPERAPTIHMLADIICVFCFRQTSSCNSTGSVRRGQHCATALPAASYPLLRWQRPRPKSRSGRRPSGARATGAPPTGSAPRRACNTDQHCPAGVARHDKTFTVRCLHVHCAHAHAHAQACLSFVFCSAEG